MVTPYVPQFGDVILTRPRRWDFWPPWGRLLQEAIRAEQRRCGYPVWQDTHAVLVLSPQQILNCTAPRVRLDRWEHVSRGLWTAWRPVFPMPDRMRAAMTEAAARLVGTRYDYGQLVSILASDLLGYRSPDYAPWFDLGARRQVCSTAVRTVFDAGRKAMEAAGEVPPFSVLFLGPDGGKLRVERTHPADFACSAGVAGGIERRLFQRAGGTT